MLINLTVTENSKKENLIGSIVIAAEKATNLSVYNTTGSKFKYLLDSRAYNASLSTLKATNTVASIVTAAGTTTYQNQVESIPVLDQTGGTATATYFNWNDFIYAVAAPTTGESYVYFAEGQFKLTKYLVNATLAELVTLADAGTQPA